MKQARQAQQPRPRRIIVMVAEDGTRVPWVFPHRWTGHDVLAWLRGPGSWVVAMDFRDGTGPHGVMND